MVLYQFTAKLHNSSCCATLSFSCQHWTAITPDLCSGPSPNASAIHIYFSLFFFTCLLQIRMFILAPFRRVLLSHLTAAEQQVARRCATVSY